MKIKERFGGVREVTVVMAKVNEPAIVVSIHEIKPSHYNRVITVKGTVVSVGSPKKLIHDAVFKCLSCTQRNDSFQTIVQPMGKFMAPSNCPFCPGQKPHFRRIDAKSSYKNSQLITISEINFDSRTNEKRTSTLEVQLIDDMVDECTITDHATITGTIIEPKTSQGVSSPYYMLASKLIKGQIENITPRNLVGIKKIMSEENLLGLLVASLCPHVPGNSFAKLGILLSLVGGHESDEGDGDDDGSADFRGQVHVLLCGGPSRGKRELLKASHNVAPWSTFLDRTDPSNPVYDISHSEAERIIHAGPILLANKGLCCIDEIDKIKKQRQNIEEIMNSSIFQAAKGGFSFDIPIDVSIVATCSPKNGQYDVSKTLYENINLPPDMLNSFDLIFNLIDKPDPKEDLDYTTSVLQQTSQRSTQIVSEGDDLDLKKKLTSVRIALDETLPPKLLNKYIQYVRKNITPKFEADAIDDIRDFNFDIQDRARGTSQLAGLNETIRMLYRLCIARARLEGREVVTQQDAQDIIDLVRYTRFDLYPSDVVSTIASEAIKRVAKESTAGLANPPKRCRSSKERFVRVLQEYSKNNSKYNYTLDELSEIQSWSGQKIANFTQLVDFLNVEGFLLKKGPEKYELVIKN